MANKDKDIEQGLVSNTQSPGSRSSEKEHKAFLQGRVAHYASELRKIDRNIDRLRQSIDRLRRVKEDCTSNFRYYKRMVDLVQDPYSVKGSSGARSLQPKNSPRDIGSAPVSVEGILVSEVDAPEEPPVTKDLTPEIENIEEVIAEIAQDYKEFDPSPLTMLRPEFQDKRMEEVVLLALEKAGGEGTAVSLAKIAYDAFDINSFKRARNSLSSALRDGAGVSGWQKTTRGKFALNSLCE
ncbi:MAG: hypothetical protein AAGA67_01625 [Cyanobacteria bacterium P01_F01_bin.153]